MVNEYNRKLNKICFDQDRDFYNNLMQDCLGNNDILIYSTHNEGKWVITERFIKTLKVEIYKNWQLIIGNFIFLIW